ncbi:hypothetical protein BGZ83_007891 [Gryganskiella cystojenkinii]|nr:hypothetical protein BGZ83_007891 [Gryganskiella cystojenkinii]
MKASSMLLLAAVAVLAMSSVTLAAPMPRAEDADSFNPEDVYDETQDSYTSTAKADLHNTYCKKLASDWRDECRRGIEGTPDEEPCQTQYTARCGVCDQHYPSSFSVSR